MNPAEPAEIGGSVFTRRRFGVLTANAIAAGGLAGFLAACGGGSATSGGGATVTRGGTLVYGSGEPPSGQWDPQQNFGTTAIQVSSLVFDTLVRYDAQGRILPSLATRWERLDDRRLRLTLRTDVKWHDGSPFSGDDVKATIERVANDATVAHHIFWTAASVQVEQPDTVTIVTDKPFAPLEKVLAVTNIVSAAQLKNISALRQRPIGTGYFRFGGYDGKTVKLTANKAYWGGAPLLDGVQFQIIADRGALMSALAQGQVQITYRLSPADLRTVQGRSDVKITAFPALDNVWLGFNTKAQGLRDVRVRQAIAHAIDRPGIVKLFAGYSQLPDSPLPIGGPGYTPQPQYAYDPAQARSMIKAAGAEGVTVRYPTSSGIWPYQEQVDQIIIQGLQDAGLKVSSTQLDAGKYSSDYASYDVFVQSWYMLTGDPDFSFSIYAAPLGTAIFKWADPTFAKLFAAQRETIDPNARQARIDALSKYVWEQLPLLPLHNPKWLVAYRTNVQGYQHGPTFAELLHDVWIKG